MQTILILGAGKIGHLIACLLSQYSDYQVALADKVFSKDVEKWLQNQPSILSYQADVASEDKLYEIVQQSKPHAIVSALPFFLNQTIAKFCLEQQLHYFDLTEDVAVTQFIQHIAKDSCSAFIPQCGIAPGFIGLAAYSLMQEFDQVENVFLRVGALPQNSHGQMKYAINWSIDGLINEYLQPCRVIHNGQMAVTAPLNDYETISLNGEIYEAFNSSGGIGSLVELCQNKVKNMNYKTLRYLGHCEKIKFLLHELKLAERPKLIKSIMKNAYPSTEQDVVVVYISISGHQKKKYKEKNYFKKVYPQSIGNEQWSAIQVATAASLCAIVDLFFEKKKQQTGFIFQEQFSLPDFLTNRFGKIFQ